MPARVSVLAGMALLAATVCGSAQMLPPLPPPPGFVTPYEIMRTVRAAGFDPLAPPSREGATYIVRATDFRGVLMRVVVDAHTGAIRDATRIVQGPYDAPGYYGQGSYGQRYYGQGYYGQRYYGQGYYAPGSSGSDYYGPAYGAAPPPYDASLEARPGPYGPPPDDDDDPDMMPPDGGAPPYPTPPRLPPATRPAPRPAVTVLPPLPRSRPDASTAAVPPAAATPGEKPQTAKAAPVPAAPSTVTPAGSAAAPAPSSPPSAPVAAAARPAPARPAPIND